MARWCPRLLSNGRIHAHVCDAEWAGDVAHNGRAGSQGVHSRRIRQDRPLKRHPGVFFWVVALGAIPCPPAWTSPDAKPSVEWSFTFPGNGTNESSGLDDVLASARAAGRPVMIDFSAEW